MSESGNVIYQISQENLLALVEKLDAMREQRKSVVIADNDKMLTKKEVMKLLQTTYSTLWRWEKSGVLTPIHLGGGRSVRYKLGDVLKFKDNGKN